MVYLLFVRSIYILALALFAQEPIDDFADFCQKKLNPIAEAHENVACDSYFEQQTGNTFHGLRMRVRLLNQNVSVLSKRLSIRPDLQQPIWTETEESPIQFGTLRNLDYSAILRFVDETPQIDSVMAPDGKFEVDMPWIVLPEIFIPYSKLINDPRIKINAFTDFTYKNAPAKKLEVRARWSIGDGDFESCNFEIIFDAESGYCLYVKEVFETSVTKTREIFYTKKTNNGFRLDSAEILTEFSHGTTGKSVYNNFDYETPNRKDFFYLSHYGLPEPEQYMPKPWLPFWAKILLVGVGLVAFSLVVRRFIKK
jgi:hypothetical protein